VRWLIFPPRNAGNGRSNNYFLRRGAGARGTTDRVISRRDLALSIRAPFFTGDIRPAGHLIPGHASQNLNLAGKWTTSINPVRSARAGNAANIFRVRSGRARARARPSEWRPGVLIIAEDKSEI